MFDLGTLREDEALQRHLTHLLPTELRSIGCYVGIGSTEELLQRLCRARYEALKRLPLSGLTIYRTSDIAPGYINYLSLQAFNELIALRKVQKDTPITLRFQHGNVFAYVSSKDIDRKVLLTDETYLFAKETTRQIWLVKNGKPTNPNRLYGRYEYDEITTTAERLSTVPGFNALYIREEWDDSLL